MGKNLFFVMFVVYLFFSGAPALAAGPALEAKLGFDQPIDTVAGNNTLFGSFRLDASQSDEDVEFLEIPAQFITAQGGSFSDLSTAVFYNFTADKTESFSAVMSHDAQTDEVKFTFGQSIVVPKGTSRVFTLNIVVGNQAPTGAYYRFIVDGAQMQITGVASGLTVNGSGIASGSTVSVVSAPVVTFFSPYKGERVAIGRNKQIGLQISNSQGAKVYLYLYRVNGNNLEYVSTLVTNASTQEGYNYFLWNVSSELPEGQYEINGSINLPRIGFSIPGNRFELLHAPELDVVSPAVVGVGGTITLRGKYFTPNGNSVTIDNFGGAYAYRQLFAASSDGKKIQFNLPATLLRSGEFGIEEAALTPGIYRVRVSNQNGSSGEFYFTVIEKSLAVLSPQEGDVFEKGEIIPVLWNADGIEQLTLSIETIDGWKKEVGRVSASESQTPFQPGIETREGSYRIVLADTEGGVVAQSGVFTITAKTELPPPLKDPRILSLSGPQKSLEIGESAAWTLIVQVDTRSSLMVFAEIGGDEFFPSEQKRLGEGLYEITFVHEFSEAGTHNPIFQVVDLTSFEIDYEEGQVVVNKAPLLPPSSFPADLTIKVSSGIDFEVERADGSTLILKGKVNKKGTRAYFKVSKPKNSSRPNEHVNGTNSEF